MYLDRIFDNIQFGSTLSDFITPKVINEQSLLDKESSFRSETPGTFFCLPFVHINVNR